MFSSRLTPSAAAPGSHLPPTPLQKCNEPAAPAQAAMQHQHPTATLHASALCSSSSSWCCSAVFMLLTSCSPAACLVVVGDLAVVHSSGSAVIHHLAIGDRGVHHPVIARLHAARHLALHVRVGVLEQGRTGELALAELQPGQAVLAGRKGARQLPHDPALATLWHHGDGEAVADLQQRLHGAVLLHRHRQAGRVEAGLGHPAGKHGGGGVLAGGCQHRQRAHQAASSQLRPRRRRCGPHTRRGGRLLGLGLLLDRQRQVAPAVLAHQHVLGSGLELDADGGEGELEARVLQPPLHLVHRLAAPPEAAKHAAGQALGGLLADDGAQRHRHLGGHVAAQGGRAQDEAVRVAHSGRHLLQAHQLQVVHLHAHARLGHAARDGLRQRGGVAVRGRVEHGDRRRVLRLDLLADPVAVLTQQLGHRLGHGGAVHGRKHGHVHARGAGGGRAGGRGGGGGA
mmetsp:Transcript_38116/g.96381  ORF Transcript_38116/g.96381 Transcript_38116/m.96381 type:complete len:455 (-) Transcript_38116:1154-2518(-)